MLNDKLEKHRKYVSYLERYFGSSFLCIPADYVT